MLYPDGSINVMAPPADDRALSEANGMRDSWNKNQHGLAQVVSIDIGPSDIVVIE